MSDLLSILIVNGDAETSDAFGALPDAQIASTHSGSGAWIEGLRAHPIDILVMELSPNADFTPMLSIMERVRAHFPDIAIFVTSSSKSPDLIIAAMRAGASEFFSKPVPGPDLMAAVDRCRRRRDAHSGRNQAGKLIAVFSNTGGAGVTTLAVNLGIALAQGESGRTALVDLNLHHGDAASFLNLEPKYSIVDACESGDLVNSDKLQSCLAQHSSGLSVLAEPPHPKAAESVSPRHVQAVLHHLRSLFQYVVIDMPHVVEPRVMAALDVSNSIILTTVATIPAVRSTRKLISYFRELGYPSDKVKLVVNRIAKVDRITTADIARTLEIETFWTCPNNYVASTDALNTGVPLVMQKKPSNIGKSILDMAAAVHRYSSNGHSS